MLPRHMVPTTLAEAIQIQQLQDAADRGSQSAQEILVTLKDRTPKYGKYSVMAEAAQRIKETLRGHPNWDKLPADMQESLDMIALKMARIVCGNPNLVDSWHDIQGYAKLIEDQLTDRSGV